MFKKKLLLLALAVLALIAVALVLSNVNAGDPGGGGVHDLIRALV